ncbi:MAG: hypothetical protein ACLR6B_01655 [Blautia sp.]
MWKLTENVQTASEAKVLEAVSFLQTRLDSPALKCYYSEQRTIWCKDKMKNTKYSIDETGRQQHEIPQYYQR